MTNRCPQCGREGHADNDCPFEVHQTVEKVYPHIEDLHDLPVRGIKQLATEFYDEVKKTITN